MEPGPAEVGLDHLHFHDLRRAAGTLVAATCAGTKELMYRLGHVSPQAALRYQHATRDHDMTITAMIRSARSAPAEVEDPVSRAQPEETAAIP